MAKRMLFIAIGIFVLALPSDIIAQEFILPKIWLATRKNNDNVIIYDKLNQDKSTSLFGVECITNYHSTVYLADTFLYFVYDSLRYDSTATIITVYETDDDNTLGLWQIGTDKNRQLWLNSTRVSYKNYSVRYRGENEKGVIIHTMYYEYPPKDSNIVYSGKDTLFIGKEGYNNGKKNFCEFLYFKGKLDKVQQHQIESFLAIKYGALLHNVYINSNSDTLWSSKGEDSLYSFGVCGIGRDDVFPLLQKKSTIRNDILTLECSNDIDDSHYIIMGHDNNEPIFEDTLLFIDTIQIHPIARQWKLRAHTKDREYKTTLILAIPPYFNGNKAKLLINEHYNDILTNNSRIIEPDTIMNTAVVFDNLIWQDGKEYYLTIVFEKDNVNNKSTKSLNNKNNNDANSSNTATIGDNIRIHINPNPSIGKFELTIEQDKEDFIAFHISNAQGKVIEHKQSYRKEKTLSFSGYIYEAGVYFVTVQSNGIQKSIKLIVK